MGSRSAILPIPHRGLCDAEHFGNVLLLKAKVQASFSDMVADGDEVLDCSVVRCDAFASHLWSFYIFQAAAAEVKVS